MKCRARVSGRVRRCVAAGAALVPLVVLGALCAPAQAGTSGQTWERYVLTPRQRTIAPAGVVRVDGRGGVVTSPAGSLRPGGSALVLTKRHAGDDPRVILDFGREVGGFLQVDFAGAGPDTLFAFSESLGAMGDWGDSFGASSTEALADAGKPQRDRRYESPHEHAPDAAGTWRDPVIRGGFRYLMIRLAPEAPAGASVSIDAVRLRYSPLPGVRLDPGDLYAGRFLSSDDGLNRIWYAGANTLATNIIDPAQGQENGRYTVGIGDRVIVDGAKRDRLVWNGDLSVSDRLDYLTFHDLDAVRNSLRTIAAHQRDDGYLTACSPVGPAASFCQSLLEYTLWWIWDLQDYYLYTGDGAFLDEMWPVAVRAFDYLRSRTHVPDTIGNEARDSAPVVQPGHTLGQSFTVDRPFSAVSGSFPTYAQSGSDMTLSLYRGGPGGTLVERRRFTDIVDNAWDELRFDAELPPGTYYLELSDPDGTVAWYSNSTDSYSAGQAFADGEPVAGDRTLRISVARTGDEPLLDVSAQPNHWVYADSGRETEVNALYVGVLRRAARIAARRGEQQRASSWRELAGHVSAGVNEELWDPARGAYRQSTGQPGNLPQDGNVLAALFGVAPAERAASALDAVRDHLWTPYGSKAGDGTMPSLVGPFMNYWEALARFGAGRDAEAWELMRRVWGYLFLEPRRIGGVTEPPGTSAWEHVLVPDGTPYSPFAFLPTGGSLSHGWSAGATALLTEQVLGVTPGRPGYRRYEVAPHPGSLRWARGRIPTPAGAIEVSWRVQQGRRFTLALHAPAGTVGTLALPAPATGSPLSVRCDGHRLSDPEIRNGRVVLRGIRAGAHRVVVTTQDRSGRRTR